MLAMMMASVTPVAEGMRMLIGLVAALACSALIIAVYDVISVGRERRALKEVPRDPAVAAAVAEIMRARNSFTEIVARYESALSSSSRVLSPSTETTHADTHFDEPTSPPMLLGQDLSEDGLSIEELAEDKDLARVRLYDARRLWETVRPGAGPAASSNLWAGYGYLRAWHLGLIGFERIYYRFDHVLDPTCWSIHEASRFRFGLAIGAEHQRLALFAVGAEASQLGELSARAFRGSEAAIRPGFVPLRFWRRVRRSKVARQASHALLDSTRISELITGPGTHARAAVHHAFETELGAELTNRTLIPDGPALISVITKGPSVLVGAWGGRSPKPVLRASSDHGAWQ